MWVYFITWTMGYIANKKFNDNVYKYVAGSALYAYVSHYFFIRARRSDVQLQGQKLNFSDMMGRLLCTRRKSIFSTKSCSSLSQRQKSLLLLRPSFPRPRPKKLLLLFQEVRQLSERNHLFWDHPSFLPCLRQNSSSLSRTFLVLPTAIAVRAKVVVSAGSSPTFPRAVPFSSETESTFLRSDMPTFSRGNFLEYSCSFSPSFSSCSKSSSVMPKKVVVVAQPERAR